MLSPSLPWLVCTPTSSVAGDLNPKKPSRNVVGNEEIKQTLCKWRVEEGSCRSLSWISLVSRRALPKIERYAGYGAYVVMRRGRI
jgi:hypothetical protein